jgi:hypothetical protein
MIAKRLPKVRRQMSSETPENLSGPRTPPDADVAGPTEAEIEEWAERERKRRQEWLSGPTPAEREAYAQAQRERGQADGSGAAARAAELARQGGRHMRESQLAAEGAVLMMTRWSRRAFAELMQAGREWEEEAIKPDAKRRIRLDDDTP